VTAAAAWLLPLVAGVGVWALGARVPLARRPWVVGSASVLALAATLILAVLAAVGHSEVSLRWGAGLVLSLLATDVAGVVAVLVASVAIPVVAYAAVHEEAPGLPRLLGLLVVFVGVMQLLVLAADLLTLVIAWELVAAVSWALIGFSWREPDRVSRAAHAFHATRAGSAALILAAGALVAGTGSLDYTAIDVLERPLLDVVAAGVLLAAMSKSAQLPFSPWLFSAMAGPTPVSALLHSATMVAAGAYALIRLAEPLSAVVWFGPAVMAVGIATALWAGVVALAETDGKRILAASTAAQYGLMFVAVGAGAGGAAAAHLVTHAVFKSLLFLCVGVGLHATGTEDVRTWRLGRRLPRVAVASGVGALALAAVPPLGAAWSKEQIVAAAVHAGPVIGALALLAGLLSAAYAGRLQLLAFGRSGASDRGHAGRTPVVEITAVTVLAMGSLGLAALWWPGARGRIEALTDRPLIAGAAWETAVSVALVATGLAWAWSRAGGGRDGALVPAAARQAAVGWFGIMTASRRGIVEPVLAAAVALGRFDVVADAPARVVAGLGSRAGAALPRFDDAVVDGAVRAVTRAGRLASRALAWWLERGVDGVVAALATATTWVAAASRIGDDRGVDGGVEGIAGAVGAAGRRSRALQTGLAHHYYVIAVVGLVALLVVAAIWR
jgi:NADH:ubiquinone oxidoreductase subunit 5 (subunit L)/multisubunit Na+/H+ antiporter MnhA subunit